MLTDCKGSFKGSRSVRKSQRWLRSLTGVLITDVYRKFKQGFVRGAGRLREWLQGELQLYLKCHYHKNIPQKACQFSDYNVNNSYTKFETIYIQADLNL